MNKIGTLPEGPWLYRPNKFDDWGVVRLGKDGPILAVARSGSHDVDEDKHRHDRTDPYEDIGQAIAAIPNMRREIARLRSALDAIRRHSDKDTDAHELALEALEAAP